MMPPGVRLLCLCVLISGLLTAPLSAADDADQAIIAALHEQNYIGAKDLAETALKQAPEDPRLWTLHGFALSHLAKEADALTSYLRALKLKPDYLPALEGAAQIEYSEGSQRAVPLLAAVLKQHPEDKTSHAMLAVLAYKRADCKTAVDHFPQSEPLIDSDVSALQQYGSCLVKLGRAQDAVGVFERLLTIQPAGNKARYNLALVQALAGRYPDVIATLGTMISPDADSLALLGEAYEATGDTPRAVETSRRAILMDPGNYRRYVDFANLCLAHASFQPGVDMLDAGLKRLPHSAPLYLARAILYIQLGRYSDSDKDLATAERLNPAMQDISVAQGMAELQRDRLENAESVIRDRLRRDPQNAFLLYLLSETIARRGAEPGTPAFQDAVNAAVRAVSIQPDLVLARDVLSRLYLQEGKTNEAIEQSTLALKLDPADQTALYHLIMALRKANRTDEVPQLAKRLAALRQQAQAKEIAQRKFAIVEPASH